MRFQSRITLCNIERVRVVGNIQQLGDIRLSGVATILDAETALVGELIAEVERGRQVRDVPDRIHIDSAVVLNIVRVLRLNQESQVIVVFLLIIAQHHPDVMRIVLILRVTTQVPVEEAIQRFIYR